MSDDSTVVVPHTQSDEYSYLSTLLADTQRTNAQLQKQLQDQFRLSLEDSDKIRKMTRKVNQLETSLQKMKAENYTLKIYIDELKCKKGEQKLARKEPVLIHEKLVFEKKKDNEEKRTKNQFVLKENISHKASNADSSADQPTMVENIALSEKENTVEGCGGKPRKKMATFADVVESISGRGRLGGRCWPRPPRTGRRCGRGPASRRAGRNSMRPTRCSWGSRTPRPSASSSNQ